MKREELPELLRDLPEGAIIVSHSQAGTWDSCKHKWKLMYRDEWRPVKQPTYFRQGNYVHELLDTIYSNPSMTMEGFDNLLDEKLKEMLVEYPDYESMALIANSGRLVKKYVQDVLIFDILNFEILETEYHFVVELQTPTGHTYYLQGYVDLIVRNRKTGRIEFMDHKTHQSRPWTPMQVQMDSQLPLYGAALNKIGLNVQTCYINMLNTYEYKDMSKVTSEKLFKRERSYRTDQEYQHALDHMGRIVDEMLSAVSWKENFGESHSVFRKTLNKECSSCWFNEACLMETKGMDPTPFLLAKFRKKEHEAVEDTLDIAVELG